MDPSTIEGRKAFHALLGELGVQVFSMYEGLRDVRVWRDDQTQKRLSRLGEVGAGPTTSMLGSKNSS